MFVRMCQNFYYCCTGQCGIILGWPLSMRMRPVRSPTLLSPICCQGGWKLFFLPNTCHWWWWWTWSPCWTRWLQLNCLCFHWRPRRLSGLYAVGWLQWRLWGYVWWCGPWHFRSGSTTPVWRWSTHHSLDICFWVLPGECSRSCQPQILGWTLFLVFLWLCLACELLLLWIS